MTLYKW